MNSLLRSVPKPIRDDTPDPNVVTFKGNYGSDGALFSVINHLREIGIVKQGRFIRRQDGSIEQTITLNLYELAKNYATPPEKPYTDKSGDLYVMHNRSTTSKCSKSESASMCRFA